MTAVKIYDDVDDNLLKFAVIIAKKGKEFIYCKHKDRNTLEVPGGHREKGENIFDTAKRELYEETGAKEFDIRPICIYSVTALDDLEGRESFGMLFYAEVKTSETELHSEIEKNVLMSGYPENWTYPDIQPKLMEEAKKRGFI